MIISYAIIVCKYVDFDFSPQNFPVDFDFSPQNFPVDFDFLFKQYYD